MILVSKRVEKAPREGFEPSTPCLEGRCSIQTELPGQYLSDSGSDDHLRDGSILKNQYPCKSSNWCGCLRRFRRMRRCSPSKNLRTTGRRFFSLCLASMKANRPCHVLIRPYDRMTGCLEKGTLCCCRGETNVPLRLPDFPGRLPFFMFCFPCLGG